MNLPQKVKEAEVSQQSRQKAAATKMREEKASQKQAKMLNLSMTSSNQKALSSQLHLNANEDLAKEADRELLEDYAVAENQAMLETMYQGCDDREAEMKFSELDLQMAEKIEMLASDSVIRANYLKLGKQQPVLREAITESMGALKTTMDRERKKNVVVGEHSKPYRDVWLAIDEGIKWQNLKG